MTTAQSPHVPLEREGFLGGPSEVDRGEQPIDLGFTQRAIQPGKKKKDGAREGHLQKRYAQRELEGRTCSGGRCSAKEGTFDGTAAVGNILRNHQKARVGFGMEQARAPIGACGQFRFLVDSRVEVNLGGLRAGYWFLPGAPGIEEGLMNRQKAVEADEEQGRAALRASLQDGDEIERQS